MKKMVTAFFGLPVLFIVAAIMGPKIDAQTVYISPFVKQLETFGKGTCERAGFEYASESKLIVTDDMVRSFLRACNAQVMRERAADPAIVSGGGVRIYGTK
jgi:hypothetical protein